MQIETNLRHAAEIGGPPCVARANLPSYPSYPTDPTDPTDTTPPPPRLLAKLLARLCLPAISFGLLLPAGAQPPQLPPPNDNLTNAQPLLGVSGSVNGNNHFATTQTGEPAPVPTIPSGASIWYLWTAPMSNYMTFDTRNSTDLYGNNLDTVMAVYSVPGNGSTLTLGSLTKVASNDDDPYGPVIGQAGVSRLSFSALPGTTYAIQVEGKIVAGVTNEGYIVLNWHPAVAAGLVSFVTNMYAFEQSDNLPLGNSLNLGTVTNIGSTANLGFGRVSLNRNTAYNGRIQVDLTLASDFYRNIYTTNSWITNIYIGPSDENGNPLPGPSTNISIYSTNYIFTLGYDVLGRSASYNVILFAQTIVSNASGSFPFTYRTNNCNSNAPDPGNLGQLPVAVSTNVVTTGTNSTTNFFVMSTNVVAPASQSLSFLTPSAVDGVDFYSSDYQTLTFDDYQMSVDAFVNVSPSSSAGFPNGPVSSGPDWPDRLGNLVAPGIPRRVILQLSNVRLDALESLDVAVPTLAPNEVVPDGSGAMAGGGFFTGPSSVAVMAIQDIYNIRPGAVTGLPDTCTNYDAINFANRAIWYPKPAQQTTNDFGIPAVSFTVYRYGPTDHSTTVDYTVNGLSGNPLAWGLPTQQEPGADYAIGELMLPSPQPPWNFATLENSDFRAPYGSAPGTITFPAKNPPDISARAPASPYLSTIMVRSNLTATSRFSSPCPTAMTPGTSSATSPPAASSSSLTPI